MKFTFTKNLFETTDKTHPVDILISLLDVIDPEYKYHPKGIKCDQIALNVKKDGSLSKKTHPFEIHHENGNHNDNSPYNIKLVRTDDHYLKRTDSYPTIGQILDEYFKNLEIKIEDTVEQIEKYEQLSLF